MKKYFENMEVQPTISDTIPITYGLCFMIGTALFFETINRYILKRYYDQDFSEAESDSFFKWKNIFISWIHSLVITFSVISCVCAYAKDMWLDLIEFYNLPIYCLTVFAVGYFIYDFTDIWRYDRSQFGVLLHHVCVIGNFVYNVLACQCLPLNVIALSVEINTLFLHSRKLLQIRKVSFDHWFYRTVCWANLLTYLFIRFGALSLLAYGFYVNGHRVNFYYLTWLWPSWFTMTGITVVLFWRLIKSDIIKYYGKKKKTINKILNNNEKDVFLQIHDHPVHSCNGHIPTKQD